MYLDIIYAPNLLETLYHAHFAVSTVVSIRNSLTASEEKYRNFKFYFTSEKKTRKEYIH